MSQPLDPAQLADKLFPDLMAVATGAAAYPVIDDPIGRRLVASNVLAMLQLQQNYQITLALRDLGEQLGEQLDDLHQESKRSRGLLRKQLKALEVIARAWEGDSAPEPELDLEPAKKKKAAKRSAAPSLDAPELLEASA